MKTHRTQLLQCSPRVAVLAITALVAVVAAFLPAARVDASGAIWLPTVAATQGTFDNIHPAMVTLDKHAYILTTRDIGKRTQEVYLTTNDDPSATWHSVRIAGVAQGPGSGRDQEYTALAVDPSTGILYATWVYHFTAQNDAVGVWNSHNGGATWTGPTNILTGSFAGPPSIAAAKGKVFVAVSGAPHIVAVSGAPHIGSCQDTNSRTDDVLFVTDAGGTWSRPQNLTSCVSPTAVLEFTAPKITVDGSGHVYLVSYSIDYSLWYMDNAGAGWSQPVRIVKSIDDLGQFYGGYRDDYRIAVTSGTVYVAYSDKDSNHPETPYGYHDIFLAMHPYGGTWTTQQVTHNANNCVTLQTSLVASGGRLGLAYIITRLCTGSGGPNASIPRVLTGTPGHWATGIPVVPARSDCTSPALSTDATIFRFVVVCGGPGGNAHVHGDLYYMPEFLDVTGPVITHLAVTATATAPEVQLSWHAEDPMPGAGVADYEVQVSEDGGSWQLAVPGGVTPASALIDKSVSAGHRYTFRVRARDKVNNWGDWVFAGFTPATDPVTETIVITSLVPGGSTSAPTVKILTPPVAALHINGMPSDGTHGLGFTPNRFRVLLVRHHNDAATRTALPASVDLSRYDPPVGNQGNVNSCAAWASGYALRGWYANRDGYYPSQGFAPMYTYAQIVKGQNVGTDFSANLNIQQQQGLDSLANYTQGNVDYTDLPTQPETINAVQDKIFSYNDVGNGGGTSLQTWIEGSIASGNPVAINFPVYDNFYNDFVGSSNYTTYISGISGKLEGNHAVFASKYDANGLWIENSWGTNFGLNGYVELSWGFVNQYAGEAVNITPVPLQRKFQALDSTTVYVLGSDGNLWRETGNSSNRTLVDGHVAEFHAQDSTTVYVLGTDGNLWRETGNSSNRTRIDGHVAEFQALDSTTVYVLGINGTLWHELGNGNYTNRALVDVNVSQFQAMDGTTVYVLRTKGTLWREHGNYTNRSLVDASVSRFQALDNTTVYVLRINGNLWREHGNYTNRAQVDATVSQFQALDSTTVYVLGDNGNLWRETGDFTNRAQVDVTVSQFQALDSTTVYVLDNNGNLWREIGDYTNRTLVDASV